MKCKSNTIVWRIYLVASMQPRKTKGNLFQKFNRVPALNQQKKKNNTSSRQLGS